MIFYFIIQFDFYLPIQFIIIFDIPATQEKSFFRPLLIMSQNILSMLLLYFIMHVWIRFVLFTFFIWFISSTYHVHVILINFFFCTCAFRFIFGWNIFFFFGITKFFCRFFFFISTFLNWLMKVLRRFVSNLRWN